MEGRKECPIDLVMKLPWTRSPTRKYLQYYYSHLDATASRLNGPHQPQTARQGTCFVLLQRLQKAGSLRQITLRRAAFCSAAISNTYYRQAGVIFKVMLPSTNPSPILACASRPISWTSAECKDTQTYFLTNPLESAARLRSIRELNRSCLPKNREYDREM